MFLGGAHYINNTSIWLHWGADVSASASKGGFHSLRLLSSIDPASIGKGPLTRLVHVSIIKPG